MATRDDEGLASRKLAGWLRSEIEEGTNYPAGARLPTYRKLAETHGVARNTAAVAVRLLEREGLVEIRGTSGAFVRDRAAGSELVSELASVRRQLREAREVLLATEAAVAGLLTRFPEQGARE